MTDTDPTKTSYQADAAPRHEGDDVRKFAYDPSSIPTLTEAQINGIYEYAWDLPDVSDEERVQAIYGKLSDAGADLSQVRDGSLVVHYRDEKGGIDDVRAIDVRDYRNFGTRVTRAELVAVEKGNQTESTGQEEVTSHERSNELLDALEDRVSTLEENMREQVEQSTKDAHIVDRFLSMIDSLVATLKSDNPSISTDTLGRLIDEAETAQAITNREEVEAREGKKELKLLHDAVETVRGLRITEGVVMSQRTVSTSEMIAMNRANNETLVSDIKQCIDSIFKTLNELQYSQSHGREEYAKRLHINLNTVRPSLSHHRALDRTVVSDQNGLAELCRLLRDEKL